MENKGIGLIKHAFHLGYRITKEGEVLNPKGKIINSFTNGKFDTYYSFSIRDYDKWDYAKKVKVHRLQAYQKYGDEMFNDGIVVRHFNGESFDNSWDNILIGTHSDNRMDILEEIRIESATTASRKMQDSSREYDVRLLIYEDLKNEVPYSEIMLKHNVSSKGTLSFMKNKSLEYKEYSALYPSD